MEPSHGPSGSMPFGGTYLDIVEVSMHPKRMTPTWVIINAGRVGAVAWSVIFVLRLLAFFEPMIVDELCALLGRLASHCSAHPWPTSHEFWYGKLLELIHPTIVVVAVACSAIHDLIELWRCR